jgi:serine/threonine protein phosphatase PrpC
LKYAAKTDRGLIRELNEDSFKIIVGDNSCYFAFIVADGMGGHKCGELASRVAVEYISDSIEQASQNLAFPEKRSEALKRIVEGTNAAVYQKSLELPEASGMGTTLTMAVVTQSDITVAHVGDSRLYIVRDENIRQITEDHSYIEELIKKGTITRDEAENHPQKHIITRAIGSSLEIDIDITNMTIDSGDIFVLCTDGLTNMVSSEQILKTVKENEPEEACEQLVEAAKRNGGDDNITVIVIKYK